MRPVAATAAVLALLASHAPGVLGGAADVSKREQADWLRWLIPLPRQIRIEKKLELPASDVRVTLRKGAGEVEQTAAEELRALFKNKAGAGAQAGRFEILLGVCDAAGKLEDVTVPDAAKLAKLPNARQAYAIRPVGENRLVLAALDERGVFYAAQTLRQLLESRFKDGKVTLPLATVLDWPDLAERGLWGGSATKEVVWMARHKMNLVEAHVRLGMTQAGRGEAEADAKLLALGHRHALKVVPIITHLDQLHRSGIYRMFPELKGKGKRAGAWSGRTTAPCFAQPKTCEVLADWMAALAAQAGVTDVCAWLSESHVQCGCPKCRAEGQFVMETRAVVRAWRLARQKHPKLGLRILLTQGSYKTNDKVLAEAPPGVGITYYDGGRTYDSSREPMIYPLLEKFAAQGRWLGCYPQLTASWRIVCPWSGPQFIRARMNEFVDKKLACLCGYATPNNRLYDFNITAAAEWAWNAKGRSEREFAAAWATRRGLKDPDAAAEWAVLLGPVGWDVYGSRIPYSQFFGPAAGLVAGRRKPVLGESMFRYFPTAEHIAADLAACEKATAIAQRLGSPAILAETRVIQGYVQMVSGLHAIAKATSARRTPSFAQRVELQKAFAGLCAAGVGAATGLRDWEACVGQGIGGSRFVDTVDVTEKTVVGIGNALEPLGIRNPIKPYLRKDIGGWATADFDEKARIVKTFDVTEHAATPGTYRVGFKYTTGWWGLSIRRVALASEPRDKPGQRAELSVDEHPGVAAVRNKANTYTLTLKQHDPALRYFVLADIQGVTSRGKPAGRQGCNGAVWMKAILPDDWQARLASVRPLTDAELAQRRALKFAGKGLRVAVVQGGYGSTSLLAALRKAKGIDAQPVAGLHPDALRRCQVLVLPQPKAPIGAEAVRELEAFVRAGGGLITTHNAVGYRGHPLILTDVCARGLEHVRDEHWLVVADHPATAGIARDKPLPHGYYDHIELEPGPKGHVLARAADTRRPVVVAGTVGKGRYVACGLAIGLAPSDKDAPPTPAERLLLENAVRWCGH